MQQLGWSLRILGMNTGIATCKVRSGFWPKGGGTREYAVRQTERSQQVDNMNAGGPARQRQMCFHSCVQEGLFGGGGQSAWVCSKAGRDSPKSSFCLTHFGLQLYCENERLVEPGTRKRNEHACAPCGRNHEVVVSALKQALHMQSTELGQRALAPKGSHVCSTLCKGSYSVCVYLFSSQCIHVGIPV